MPQFTHFTDTYRIERQFYAGLATLDSSFTNVWRITLHISGQLRTPRGSGGGLGGRDRAVRPDPLPVDYQVAASELGRRGPEARLSTHVQRPAAWRETRAGVAKLGQLQEEEALDGNILLEL